MNIHFPLIAVANFFVACFPSNPLMIQTSWGRHTSHLPFHTYTRAHVHTHTHTHTDIQRESNKPYLKGAKRTKKRRIRTKSIHWKLKIGDTLLWLQKDRKTFAYERKERNERQVIMIVVAIRQQGGHPVLVHNQNWEPAMQWCCAALVGYWSQNTAPLKLLHNWTKTMTLLPT